MCTRSFFACRWCAVREARLMNNSTCSCRGLAESRRVWWSPVMRGQRNQDLDNGWPKMPHVSCRPIQVPRSTQKASSQGESRKVSVVITSCCRGQFPANYLRPQSFAKCTMSHSATQRAQLCSAVEARRQVVLVGLGRRIFRQKTANKPIVVQQLELLASCSEYIQFTPPDKHSGTT